MSTPISFCVRTRSRSRADSASSTRTPSPAECGQQVDLSAIAEQLEVLSQSEDAVQDHTLKSQVLVEGPVQEVEKEEVLEDMAEARGPLIIPGKFKGGFDDNVESYVTQFDRISKANGWDERKKLVVIPCYLEGAALKWYENLEARLGDAITWENVKNGLKEAFQSIAWDEQQEYRLRMRMQEGDEPVESYFQDVINLCAKVDPGMTERCQIKHVLRGLSPSLLEKVMVLENDSLQGLLSNIRRVQTARYMAGHRVDQLLGGTSRDPTANTSTGPQGFHQTPRESTSRLESQFETLASEFSKLRVRLLENSMKTTSTPVEGRDASVPQHSRDRSYNPTGGRFSGPRRGRGGRTADGRVICYRCNRVGHYAINCRQRNQDQGNENGER